MSREIEEKPLTVKALNAYLRTLGAGLQQTCLLPDTKDCFMRDMGGSLFPIEAHDVYHFVLRVGSSYKGMAETLSTLRDRGLRVAKMGTGYMDAEPSEEVAVLQLQQVHERACRAAEQVMETELSRGR